MKIALKGLIIYLGANAILFMTVSGGFPPVEHFTFTGISVFLFGIISTIYWGSRAGLEIINRTKNEDWTGIKTSYLIFFSFFLPTILLDWDYSPLGSGKQANALDGILYILLINLFPTVIFGILVGRSIKKRGLRIN